MKYTYWIKRKGFHHHEYYINVVKPILTIYTVRHKHFGFYNYKTNAFIKAIKKV